MNEANLRTYQRHCIDHVISHPKAGLLLEMGLGKTVSCLTAVNRLIFEEADIFSVLVIGPKRVVNTVWTDEIENWGHLCHLTTSKIMGTEKQRKKALNQKADIYLIGRDNVTWLCSQFGGSMLPFDMLIVDESSSFKNPTSLRFRALRKVIGSFNRVVILTGTPAPNGLIDIWSQIYLLDRGERLGATLSGFRDTYFKPDKVNGYITYSYKIQKGAEATIHEKIKDICISLKSEDHLDLPPTLYNTIKIKFDEALQLRYDSFEEEQVLELFNTDVEISAINAASLSTKLLQFANGTIYDEDKNAHVVHDLKLDALEELIEEAGGKPVLVAWTYRHDRDRILERLKKYNVVELDDGPAVKAWNEGKIEVLLMHPASGGHGLNLQFGGHIIVWFGQTWSLELYQQLNARLSRPGQKNNVIINRLVSSKTIEEDVIKALEHKTGGQERLMQAVKSKIDKYVKSKF